MRSQCDADVLGKFFSLQSLLHAAPNEKWLGNVLCKGTLELPGVCSAALYLDDEQVAYSSSPSFPVKWPATLPDDPHSLDFSAVSNVRNFSLNTPRMRIGHFVVATIQDEKFSPYLVHLENTLSLVSLVIETRHQHFVLQESAKDLQNRVEQRTASLKERDRQIRLILQSATEGIYGLDRNGRCSFCNKSCVEILGYQSEEDLLGKNMHELIHHSKKDGTVSASHDCSILTSMETGEPSHSADEVFWKSDGSSFDAEYWMHPIVDEGDVVGAVVSFLDITQRKQVERQLQQSEQLLRQSQAVARIGHYVFDLSSRRWTNSEALDEIFGIDQTFERTVEGWLSLVRSDYRELMTDYLENEVLGKKAYFNKTYPTINQANGEVVWVKGLGELVYDEHGQVMQMFGTIQDVTEQYLMQKQQVSLGNRLNSLWKVSSLINADMQDVCDCILAEMTRMTDSPYGFYGFLDDQEEVMSIYSWSKQAMQDCSVHDKPLEFPIEGSGVWGNAVRNRAPFVLNEYQDECENKTGVPRGHVALTRVMSLPVISRGKVVALGAVANKNSAYEKEDIEQLQSFLNSAQILVDRNRLELDLKDSEEFYRMLFEEAAHGSAIADEDSGVLLSCNRKLAEMVGRPVEEIIGKHQSFLHTGAAEHVVETDNFKKHKGQDEAVLLEDTLVDIEGNLIAVEIFASRMKISGRNVVHGFFYDISDRKKLMDEYRRSAQLAALGTVAAGVAHEINNPIQGILNYATILKQKPEQADRTLQISEKIIRESERISLITKEMLSFVRDDHKEKVLTDICPLLEAAIDLIEMKSLRQGVRIALSCAQELPELYLYPQSIQQVLINLIDNAVDAVLMKDASDTEQTIKVSCRTVTLEDGEFMCLEVADKGSGMQADVLEKAKETFFSTKPSSQGTGLGLSIVSDIVNKHGGRFDIDSVDGEYTHVKVYLPLHQSNS